MRGSKLILAAIAGAVLSACAAPQKVQTAHNLETVTVEHTVDTVYVNLPHEALQATVAPDSVSRLQTTVAESTARLTPDGHIEHRLVTRDTVITVPVPTIITTRTEQSESRQQQTRPPRNTTLTVAALLLAVVLSLQLVSKLRGER